MIVVLCNGRDSSSSFFSAESGFIGRRKEGWMEGRTDGILFSRSAAFPLSLRNEFFNENLLLTARANHGQ